MVGVVVGTGVIGTVSAWLVMTFRFPGRATFFPLGVGAAAGRPELSRSLRLCRSSCPLPGRRKRCCAASDRVLRARGTTGSHRVRNTGGAALILSLVLYPYVYLACVALLKLQGSRLVEASRALGTRPAGHPVRACCCRCSAPPLRRGWYLALDGDAERHRRGRVPGRGDHHLHHLRHLAHPPRRRQARRR